MQGLACLTRSSASRTSTVSTTPAVSSYLPPAAMWEALGNPSPQTIVDVGAGTGLFACWFAEAAPDATVYAIDIEPAMVRWMLEHRHPSLCSRLQPLLGKESAIPLATGEAETGAILLLLNSAAGVCFPVFHCAGNPLAIPAPPSVRRARSTSTRTTSARFPNTSPRGWARRVSAAKNA